MLYLEQLKHRTLSAAKQTFSPRKCGEAYLDMLVKILIVVLLGVALLALLNNAVPELWEDVIGEIRNKFNF